MQLSNYLNVVINLSQESHYHLEKFRHYDDLLKFMRRNEKKMRTIEKTKNAQMRTVSFGTFMKIESSTSMRI